MQLTIRPANDGDKAFLYSTWLRGLYYGSSYLGSISKAAFFKHQTTTIDRILLNPSNSLVVACFTDEPDVVLGIACLGRPSGLYDVLHWVFVKRAFRGQGIARQMLARRNIKLTTALTDDLNKYRISKGITFNPLEIT